MKKLFTAVMAFFIICSVNAYAEAEIFESVETYKVQGLSEKELRKSLSEKSPCKQDGKVFDAYTTWYVKWHFEWHNESGKYRIAKANSNVEVKFTMPEWVNYANAPINLRRKWDKYIKALKEHENGHRDLGVEAAQAVIKAIEDVPARSSGELINNAANAAANRVLERYRAQEKEYDRKTNHGATTGAVFP